MDFLIRFVVVVLLVTLLGHGLWKLFALIFRGIFKRPQRAPIQPPPLPFARTVDESEITLRQLATLREAGLIEPSVHAQVLEAIRRAYNVPASITQPIPAPREIPSIPVTATTPPPLPLPTTVSTARATPPHPAMRRPTPARPPSEALASFMQQSNIRWGELIGGLLIVGCSAALVVSFWAEISQRPIFKFSLFTAVTAVLFGLGLYTEHRWKLPTTSRGVLLIATLLVPLNCLALASFSSRGAPDALALGAQGGALVLFSWLLWLSAKVISPPWPGLLTVGTVTLSAFMMLVRIVEPVDPTPLQMLALAAASVTLYLVPSALLLRTARRWKTLHASAAEAIFLVLGVFSFATLLGGILLISQASHPESRFAISNIAQALRNICSAISATGLPALTAGLLIWQRAKGVRSNPIRIAGGAVAIVGAGILLLGLALGWPEPSALLPVAAFDFLVLLAIAFAFELPAALLLATPCLGLAWFVGFHVLAGHLAWRDTSGIAAEILLLPSGGAAFAPFALALAGTAILLFRRKRAYAKVVAFMAAASAVLTIALLNRHGFAERGDPYLATWVYLSFAVTLFFAAGRIPLAGLVFSAWILAFATFAQFFVSHETSSNPWGTSLLAWSTVAAAAFAMPRVGRSVKKLTYVDPVYWIALCGSCAGASALCVTSQGMSTAVPHALLWLAAIWLVVGLSALQLLVAAAAICFAVTGIYIHTIHPAPTELNLGQVSRLLELNSFTLSALVLIAAKFWKKFTRVELLPGSRQNHILLAAAALMFAVVVIPTAVFIALDPTSTSRSFVGNACTWLAFGALIAALFLRQKPEFHHLTISKVAATLSSLAALVACTVDRVAGPSWHAYHTLLAGCTAVGWILVGYGVWVGSRMMGLIDDPLATIPASDDLTLSYHQPIQTSAALVQARRSMMFGQRRLQPTVLTWAIGIVVGVVLLSARGALDDPAAPWWAVGAIASVASLLPMLTLWAYRPSLLYPASVLFNLAATIWFGHIGFHVFAGNALLNFVLVNVFVLGISGLAWFVLDFNIFYAAKLPRSPGPHRAAAVISILAMALLTAFCLSAKLLAAPIPPGDIRLVAASLAAILAVVVACLWDSSARQPLGNLYAVGILVIASAFAFSTLDAKSSIWWIAIALAGYIFLAAALWALRANVKAVGQYLAIPVDARQWHTRWLVPVNTTFALIVVVIAYWAGFTFSQPLHRVAPALGALSCGVALVLLASGNLSVNVRQSALAVFALSAVAIVWAIIPLSNSMMLDRAVSVFVVLAALGAIYLLLIPRALPAGSAWAPVVAREGVHLGMIAGGALLVALGIEVSSYLTHSRLRISRVDIAVVLVALLATCALLVIAAIRKKVLPGGIRSACIYVAEVSLALAFVHLRVTMPQLFGGMFAAYWPLVLMAIAFVGVGAAEALRRRYDAALIRPIEQSGIFLPLLPVLAFWAAPPRAVNFGELLVTVALFYGVVSVLRRSFVFAIVGVLAANGALWYLLHRTPGWAFNEHPQVWLIPGALAVLIAAQFNRKRMSVEQLRAVRYACLLVIYTSSTADVFLNGVARQPWLPLVLAALSVFGVLLGIALRIRPFLYLGTSFLLISIITMIYFAFSALHWTWIGWVTGIALGIAILIFFTLIEKKREDMVAIVQNLRQWQ